MEQPETESKSSEGEDVLKDVVAQNENDPSEYPLDKSVEQAAEQKPDINESTGEGEAVSEGEIWEPPAVEEAVSEGGIWEPPVMDEVQPFEDKGEKDAAVAEKKRFNLILEYRATSVSKEPNNAELGEVAAQLVYLTYYMGLTSTTSLQFEAEKVTYEDEADWSWARVDWAKLLDTEARIDLELAGLWSGNDSSGFRTAFTYGWPAGLNLDLAVRLQTSRVEDNWGYQVEVEGLAFLTPTTATWARGFFYWDQNDTEKSQFGVGVAQSLGHRTGLHAEAYLGDAESVDPTDGDLEASSASVRIELRHRLLRKDTLLRVAYLNYYDSWHIAAKSYSIRVDQPFKDGSSLGVGYRIYTNSEGLEAGTWMLTAAYYW